MKDLLLSAKNLSVRFGGVLAVNNVSFDVKQGEVFTLIGPNGAGKTTVFNLISRIYTPTTGTIEVCRGRTTRHPWSRPNCGPWWRQSGMWKLLWATAPSDRRRPS
jgi:branched-chain amino acid transport system ATP-binding protein